MKFLRYDRLGRDITAIIPDMPTCKIISYPEPISYARGLVEQNRILDALLTGDGVDTLMLLEHKPTITVGRGSVPTDLLRTHEELRADGIDVVETDRGGEITYHGPGQLVAYPILNLEAHGRDLHQYLRKLEETIIRTIAHFGIDGGRDPGYTGVWTSNRKIAAIGIKARRWVTMHGIALNVDDDLTPFRRDFVPCGISDRGVTSMQEELDAPITRADIEPVFISQFCKIFGVTAES